MNILVTHVSYHCSVGVIKLLRKIRTWNIKIIGCSSFPMGMCSGSILVDKFFRAPVLEESQKYLDFIQKILETEQIDYIISPDEEELLLFNQYKETFRDKVVLPLLKRYNYFSINTRHHKP